MNYYLVDVFKYREKRFGNSTAKFPLENPLIQELRNLIPPNQIDNHQMATFSVGEDSWGNTCFIAILFSDFNAYVGDPLDIENSM